MISLTVSDALDWLRSLPDSHADLVVTSPPYTGCRTYGIKAARRTDAWVAWLRPIVVEACRVARIVALNVSDQVREWSYRAGPECLIADLVRIDGLACGPAPYAWVRTGIAGSGGKHYHRRDWEPVYVLARPENLPPSYSDNLAFGKPPLFGVGGNPSHRMQSGRRHNREVAFQQPEIANPGNVVRTNGGGSFGHEIANENEAPMHLDLAARLVAWYCPPGGLVLDPFCGSGTTGQAAIEHGCRFAGCDLRESQIQLTQRRLGGITPSMFSEAA